jgi:hypothetical protein
LFGAVPFTMDLYLPVGAAHRISLYSLDWDALGRAQKIEVIDPTSGLVLDSRTLTGFTGGTYLSWNVRGYVQFRFTRTGGPNAVLSALFIDP